METPIELTKESLLHFNQMEELIYERSKTLIPEKDPDGSYYVPHVDRTEIDATHETVEIYWYVSGSRGYTNQGNLRMPLAQFLAPQAA